VYDHTEEATITNSFAHAAFRFGHSVLPSTVTLGDAAGAASGSMSLGAISSNPNQLTNNPGLLDQLLRGAAIQQSEEVDLKMVSAVRNIMFGPPGAGGTDLGAVDIQRGRDHGLPDYNTLREGYGLARLTSFNQITSDDAARQALASAYGNDIDNIDPFIGGLAEDHVVGSSLGPLFQEILRGQFKRLRDADRLWYRSNVAGLYTNGVLNASIASLVNLNTVTLADVIAANTEADGLGGNLFFAGIAGDFNHDGSVNNADLVVWRAAMQAGTMGGADLMVWQRNLGTIAPWVAATTASVMAVPEPAAGALIVAMGLAAGIRRRTSR
jgi:hypothetical protein